jgi:uncharacterized oxidoreductase|tara:strand:- start:3468 stop:4562 length:1095 start_codon:yes stop_codon:yes gene_type:complete
MSAQKNANEIVNLRSAFIEELVGKLFLNAGCSVEESTRIAKSLVDANLTGHDSHGIIRVTRYLDWLKQGVQVADQEVEVLVDNDSLLLVDGSYGMGQTVGPQAVELGIERAREYGLSIVALRKAGHLGRIGEYAEIAAKADLISIHLVNVASSQLVAPFGSKDRRMGTNPMAFGVPIPGENPIVHDFATSVIAEGKAMVALQGGAPLPPDSLVGPSGDLTNDPAVLYEIGEGNVPNSAKGSGALRAMGDHKGSGLSVMCELLAGALTGTGTAGPGKVRFANGMLSIYLDPNQIDPSNEFVGGVTDYIEWFLSAAPSSEGNPVRLPGQIEIERREARIRDGLDVPAEVWAGIKNAARTAGIDVPS